MIKFLYNLNKKFDKMKGRPRFLLFMGMMVPAIIATGFLEVAPAVATGGYVYLLTMLIIRALYIEGVFKKYLIWRRIYDL